MLVDNEGYPFEFSWKIDKHRIPVRGFDWCWTVKVHSLQCDQTTSRSTESEKPEVVTKRLFDHLDKIAELKFAGTTAYKGSHEVIFYTNRENRSSVGGYLLENGFQFIAQEDREWRKLAELFRLFQQ
jgi:hypothetical protein